MEYSPLVDTESSSTSDEAFENFIHRKTRIHNTKLEVLAFEIHQRFLIRGQNLERIDADKQDAHDLLLKVTRESNYLLRMRGDDVTVHGQLFRLEEERRKQDVECWRDVVMVMRDFLYVWEARELAKSKAMLINDHV